MGEGRQLQCGRLEKVQYSKCAQCKYGDKIDLCLD